VNTIEILENRLFDHNHQALVIATEIQTNLDNLENYLLKNENLQTSQQNSQEAESVSYKHDNNQATKL
jgi:hypothetical protein